MRKNKADEGSVRGTLPRRPDVEFISVRGIQGVSHFGAIATCRSCGATVWLEEDGAVDPIELHRRWHRRVERLGRR